MAEPPIPSGSRFPMRIDEGVDFRAVEVERSAKPYNADLAVDDPLASASIRDSGLTTPGWYPNEARRLRSCFVVA
jgi:hypothetical protein